MKFLFFFLFFLSSFLCVSLAQTDLQLENKARLIGNELRCPVCGGSAITESPSDFARSMFAEVKAQVKAGKSESEIKAYFSGKYGNTVLLKPPFSGINILVWVLPILVLIAGAFFLVGYLRRSSQKPLEATDPVLLEKVRAQLETQKAQS
jgi:cytochrome c-type biogenesis protein CcmH